MRFLGDQGALVSCSADKTVKLWSADGEGAYSTSAVFQARPALPALPAAQLAIEGLGPAPMGLALPVFSRHAANSMYKLYTPVLCLCSFWSYHVRLRSKAWRGRRPAIVLSSCQCAVAGLCTSAHGTALRLDSKGGSCDDGRAPTSSFPFFAWALGCKRRARCAAGQDHTEEVTAVTVHASGDYLVTASLDRTWAFYDLAAQLCLAQARL